MFPKKVKQFIRAKFNAVLVSVILLGFVTGLVLLPFSRTLGVACALFVMAAVVVLALSVQCE